MRRRGRGVEGVTERGRSAKERKKGKRWKEVEGGGRSGEDWKWREGAPQDIFTQKQIIGIGLVAV